MKYLKESHLTVMYFNKYFESEEANGTESDLTPLEKMKNEMEEESEESEEKEPDQ